MFALSSVALPLRLPRPPSPSPPSLHAPPRRFYARPLRPLPHRRVSASSPSSAAGLPLEELVERNWSFLDVDPAESRRTDKARRIIAGAGVEGPGSMVLAALPTAAFIDRVVELAPCELPVAVHESLLVLAMIKEAHDRVRCWQGGSTYCRRSSRISMWCLRAISPGMNVTIDQLLRLLAPKCSSGSTVVISFDEGREVVEKNHKLQFTDLVTSDLPDRVVLEKAAEDNSFQITEFVDEPDFYLAVLRFQGSSTQ